MRLANAELTWRPRPPSLTFADNCKFLPSPRDGRKFGDASILKAASACPRPVLTATALDLSLDAASLNAESALPHDDSGSMHGFSVSLP